MGLRARRYTIVIASRSSGAVRRVTISLRAILTGASAILMVPVALALGTQWKTLVEIQRLNAKNASLEMENGSYRAATGELTTQIQSLETVIDDLGARAALDPVQKQVLDSLPAVVKARATGGRAQTQTRAGVMSSVFASLTNPEDTFGVIRDLLGELGNRLTSVRHDVERQEQLVAATPSIWPTQGWLTGYFQSRSDPFTGEPEFHEGLDISTAKGRPVFATADGEVESASYSGDYGNLVVLKHDFGLATRYGHLSGFHVKVGQTVKRGDVIGYVGSSGRSTGAHLHYEILANGHPINPMQLLARTNR